MYVSPYFPICFTMIESRQLKHGVIYNIVTYALMLFMMLLSCRLKALGSCLNSYNIDQKNIAKEATVCTGHVIFR